MSGFLDQIRELVARREVRISSHGYDEMAADGILVGELLSGIQQARIVEEYPHYPKGPCI